MYVAVLARITTPDERAVRLVCLLAVQAFAGERFFGFRNSWPVGADVSSDVCGNSAHDGSEFGRGASRDRGCGQWKFLFMWPFGGKFR